MKPKLLISVIILGAVLFVFSMLQGGAGLSPNILELTLPVVSFAGTVENVQGNVVTLTKEVVVVDTTKQTPETNPNKKKLTYKVRITKDTKILSLSSIVIPYLLRPQQTLPQEKTVKDIKVGDAVGVSTTKGLDLRTYKGSQFDAGIVQLPQSFHNISGKVVSVGPNQVVVLADKPVFDQTVRKTEQEYTINVTPSTEISRLAFNTTTGVGKPEKLSLANIKKDMNIGIYSDSNLGSETNVNALLISVYPPLPSVNPTQLNTTAPSPTVIP